jgi:hypothetical protein
MGLVQQVGYSSCSVCRVQYCTVLSALIADLSYCRKEVGTALATTGCLWYCGQDMRWFKQQAFSGSCLVLLCVLCFVCDLGFSRGSSTVDPACRAAHCFVPSIMPSIAALQAECMLTQLASYTHRNTVVWCAMIVC